MDRIEKFLNKLTAKERAIFLKILTDIRTLNLARYDVKALQGAVGLFRLRKGSVRVVFAKGVERGIVVDIAFRKDIYKKG